MGKGRGGTAPPPPYSNSWIRPCTYITRNDTVFCFYHVYRNHTIYQQVWCATLIGPIVLQTVYQSILPNTVVWPKEEGCMYSNVISVNRWGSYSPSFPFLPLFSPLLSSFSLFFPLPASPLPIEAGPLTSSQAVWGSAVSSPVVSGAFQP